MPVQIQNDVDAVYEPVITIPDTGEVLTEAQIYDTTLALANRIEFLRQLNSTTSETPEQTLLIRDDFVGGVYAEPYVHSEHIWIVSDGFDISNQGVLVGEGDNPGRYHCTIPISDGWAMGLAPGGSGAIRFGDIDQLTLVASWASGVPTGAEYFVGLLSELSATPTTSAVGLWYRQATNANWLVRHMKNTVDDATISAHPAVTAEYVTWHMNRISSTQVEVYVNDTLTATLTQGVDAPDAADLVGLGAYGAAGGGGVFDVRLDIVSLRATMTGRAT